MSISKGTPLSSQIVWLEQRLKEVEAERDALKADLTLAENVASAASQYEVALNTNDDDVFDYLDKLKLALRAWRERRAAREVKP